MTDSTIVGPLHAVLLGALAACTGVVCVRRFGLPTSRRTFGAIAVGSGIALLSIATSLHRCAEGNPLMQWALPSVCATLAVVFVEDPRFRVWLASGAALLSLGLCFHYTAAVHGNTYTGHSSVDARGEWHSMFTGLYRRVPRLHTYNGTAFSVEYPAELVLESRTDSSVTFAARSDTPGPWSYETTMRVRSNAPDHAETFTTSGGSHIVTHTFELAHDGVGVRISTESDTDDWFPSDEERRVDMRRIATRTLQSFLSHN